jgi:3D (Asp-Asp-Asp) domain-containing protein
MIITSDSIVKEAAMDQEAAELSNLIMTIADSTSQTESTTTPNNIKVIKESTHIMTAYNSDVGQTDNSPCITANGFNVCEHGIEDTIATNFLPFGTKVKIPELFGDRIFVIRDRMSKKHPNRVDVWMKDKHDAIHFGVKIAKIQVIE